MFCYFISNFSKKVEFFNKKKKKLYKKILKNMDDSGHFVSLITGFLSQIVVALYNLQQIKKYLLKRRKQ